MTDTEGTTPGAPSWVIAVGVVLVGGAVIAAIFVDDLTLRVIAGLSLFQLIKYIRDERRPAGA